MQDSSIETRVVVVAEEHFLADEYSQAVESFISGLVVPL